MLGETLDTAAEILVYFKTCPETWKGLFDFVKDLFQNHSPGQILLTLNRLLHAENENIAHRTYMKATIKKIFEKFSSIYSLKHKNGVNKTKGKI